MIKNSKKNETRSKVLYPNNRHLQGTLIAVQMNVMNRMLFPYGKEQGRKDDFHHCCVTFLKSFSNYNKFKRNKMLRWKKNYLTLPDIICIRNPNTLLRNWMFSQSHSIFPTKPLVTVIILKCFFKVM